MAACAVLRAVTRAVLCSQKRAKSLIGRLSLFRFVVEGTAGPWLGRCALEAIVVVKNLRRSFAARLIEFGSRHEDGSSQFADVVTAKGHVLGDIEPGTRSACASVLHSFFPLKAYQKSR